MKNHLFFFHKAIKMDLIPYSNKKKNFGYSFFNYTLDYFGSYKPHTLSNCCFYIWVTNVRHLPSHYLTGCLRNLQRDDCGYRAGYTKAVDVWHHGGVTNLRTIIIPSLIPILVLLTSSKWLSSSCCHRGAILKDLIMSCGSGGCLGSAAEWVEPPAPAHRGGADCGPGASPNSTAQLRGRAKGGDG